MIIFLITGVFMRDLTFFNDGNNKRLKNGLYNFSKLRTMVYKVKNKKTIVNSTFRPYCIIQEGSGSSKSHCNNYRRMQNIVGKRVEP